MLTTRRTLLGLIGALALLLPARAGLTKITALQNGVSPTPAYAGCVDTAASDRRDRSGSPVLRCQAASPVLIQFDLSAIPKGHVVHKAVLRVADVGYPTAGRDGKLPSGVECHRIAQKWDPAGLYEAIRASYQLYREERKKNKDAKWTPPVVATDQETDFGQKAKGLIATDAMGYDPARGYLHELDVTEVVKRWQGGKLPNHGLALRGAGRARFDLATSEWSAPLCRPVLLIDHGPAGSQPAGIKPLGKPMPVDQLDPVAATGDEGKPSGEYGVVRVGQNANCALRGASTDAYVKEAHSRYPGAWGWMNMCRVGGRAGDCSRALLYFDLREVPKNASIKRAKLVVTLTPYSNRLVTTYPYGAFLVKLDDSPGWTGAEVTSLERKAGTAWPGGGLLAASGKKPVAIGKVIQVERESRGRKYKAPGAVEFDLTGAVRAWVGGKVANCGVVLDGRVAGGAYDFYSARSYKPDKRPCLEIELSPAIAKKPKSIEVREGLPEGDYWVGPMREAHKRFKGKPGVLTQYGDSITVTMAFMAPYGWSGKIDPKNATPEVAKEMAVIEKYADLSLWRKWKSGQWGCTGMMKSDWLFANVDTWQKRMNPEAAVILFGTNDLGGLCPPEYTEYMAASVRRMLADGTVPMLTTVPPHGGRALSMTDDYWRALICIATHYKVPVIDFYKEALRRRPDDWNGRLEKFRRPDGKNPGYGAPTIISGDGCHPANPKEFQNDFSEKALSSNGYNLRNYMTLRTYYQVISKVCQAGG